MCMSWTNIGVYVAIKRLSWTGNRCVVWLSEMAIWCEDYGHVREEMDNGVSSCYTSSSVGTVQCCVGGLPQSTSTTHFLHPSLCLLLSSFQCPSPYSPTSLEIHNLISFPLSLLCFTCFPLSLLCFTCFPLS